MLHGTRESGEELLNSCYLKRSAGDRREGGAYTARNEHLISARLCVLHRKKPIFMWSGVKLNVDMQDMSIPLLPKLA